MSCVLRVSGAHLDLDALLESFPVGAFRIWRKGEPSIPASLNTKVSADFGACFDVSVADFDEFAKQQEDATNFLVSYRSSLQRLVSFPGVEYAQLDFGINGGASWAHSVVLLPAFLRAAADAGIAVEISHYLLSGDEAALG